MPAKHPLTVKFVTELFDSIKRMCEAVISSGDDHESMSLLGEAYVFYIELAVLSSLPTMPSEIRSHARPLVAKAKELLMVAGGNIAIDRLYVMANED